MFLEYSLCPKSFVYVPHYSLYPYSKFLTLEYSLCP